MTEIDFRRDLLPLKNKLFRVALNITLDRPEAEDVVEDVLVKVWELRHTDEIQRVANLEAFCHTMTRNLARDRAERKSAQNLSLDQLDADHEDSAPRPDQIMEADDRQRWVRQLFNQLPEKQRTIMHLRDIEEHTYQEIAEIMSISESDVKVTLFRARQTFKQMVLDAQQTSDLARR